MIQKSLDNLSHKNSPLHFGFGEQDTTSSERYCTGGEFNSIAGLTSELTVARRFVASSVERSVRRDVTPAQH